MPRIAASHLRLNCLAMSHKKDTKLIWAKKLISFGSDLFSNNSLFGCQVLRRSNYERAAQVIYLGTNR